MNLSRSKWCIDSRASVNYLMGASSWQQCAVTADPRVTSSVFICMKGRGGGGRVWLIVDGLLIFPLNNKDMLLGRDRISWWLVRLKSSLIANTGLTMTHRIIVGMHGLNKSNKLLKYVVFKYLNTPEIYSIRKLYRCIVLYKFVYVKQTAFISFATIKCSIQVLLLE